jgi:glycosyltransferase involved in cell wall biosynthesis
MEGYLSQDIKQFLSQLSPDKKPLYSKGQSSPLVSIITPSFNQGQFLERTILSVKNQDYPLIEHIVVDGGSSDNTLDVLRKYHRDLTWVSEPDNGQSDAINKGFGMSKGDILAYLNADDIYLSGAIRSVVDFFSTSIQTDMIYGNYLMIDQHENVLRKCRLFDICFADLLKRNIIGQPAVFFRRRILEKVGPLDVSLRYSMDFDLWLRIASLGTIRHMNQYLSCFRIHPKSKSAKDRVKFSKEAYFKIRTKYVSNKWSLYLPYSITAARFSMKSLLSFLIGDARLERFLGILEQRL